MKILLLANGGDTELQAFKSIDELTLTISICSNASHIPDIQEYSLDRQDLIDLIEELNRLKLELYGGL